MAVVSFIYGIFSNIFLVFLGILQRLHFRSGYSFDKDVVMEVFRGMVHSIVEISTGGIFEDIHFERNQIYYYRSRKACRNMPGKSKFGKLQLAYEVKDINC